MYTENFRAVTIKVEKKYNWHAKTGERGESYKMLN
jgi:hypothetical protein